MNVFDNLKLTFKNGNTLTRLIYVNAAVFLGINIALIVLKLFKLDGEVYLDWLAVPSRLTELARRFWTPITYMFAHQSFMHILFNMLMLFWFGKLFLMYYSEKQLLALYLFGGLMGALAYVGAYNFFPYYEDARFLGVLLGASGAIMAVVVATAVKAPNTEMALLLIGRVKLIYIALAVVLISIFGVTGNNGGGEMAHLGGALAGYLFVALEKKNRDITPFFNRIIDFFVNLFRRKEPKLKARKYNAAKMSDGDFNRQKSDNEAEINRILDKIKTSGYESLNSDEKRKLFEQKK